VALADAADGRVAAHLADGREALRHEERARAIRPREGGLGAGVPAAITMTSTCSIPVLPGAVMIPKR